MVCSISASRLLAHKSPRFRNQRCFPFHCITKLHKQHFGSSNCEYLNVTSLHQLSTMHHQLAPDQLQRGLSTCCRAKRYIIIASMQPIDFKLAVLVYRCLHGLAPRYLSDYIQSVTDSNRRRLRSSSSSQLVIRRTRLSTVGDRAFPVAGSRLWNSLPPDVTSAPTLTVFRNRLKTFLFSRSFPN